MVEKFLGSAAALFLYEKKIHAAYSKYPGDASHTYDEGFRKKMQTWPGIEWDCQDVSGFTETMVSAKDGMTRKDQPFWTGWPKARPDKLQAAGKPKADTTLKAGKSGAVVYWMFEKGECKWGASCKYRQACSNCEGGHPASDCREGKPSGIRKQFPAKPHC